MLRAAGPASTEESEGQSCILLLHVKKIRFLKLILGPLYLMYYYSFLLDLLQGIEKDAIGVLRMIKRRLQAEMKTIGRNDLKMLSKLLQEDDLEV